MSVDQELSKKAYSDYANLDGNPFTIADTTYRDDFDYYGYFDSNYCYTFVDSGSAGVSSGSSYFTPYGRATASGGSALAHQCNGTGLDNITEAGAWSGNFLNWATMTRMDILRRVLFGGKRSVDLTTQTILERSYLPKDIHAFSKTYNKNDINKYTPFGSASIPKAFCNVSTGAGSSDFPVMRMATGSFPQWASSEGGQCQTGNSTSPAAYPTTKEVVVKVEACVTGKDAATSPRCKTYGTAPLKKPSGLLQKYGEDGNIKFSLTTSTYKGHFTGGVVRVPAGLFASNSPSSKDEVDLTNGIFNSSVSGIIKNINSIKVANYDWSAGNYSDCNSPGIDIPSVGSTVYKNCTDWGNPIGEVYLEMLRYISGKSTPTAGFVFDDATAATPFKGVPGLTYLSTWTDPWADWCASCSAIVISTGSNSFDGDQLGAASDIISGGATTINNITDRVGDLEARAQFGSSATFSGTYFAGGNGTTSNGYCTAMSVSGLSKISGICPEAPALKGTYNIAGLAYYAHITDLRPDLTGSGTGKKPGKRTLTTYTVDLAESVPTLKASINGNPVSFIPNCQSYNGSSWNGCSLIDVIVENLQVDSNNNPVSGSYLITWEDSSWGNDYDLDAAQRLQFCVGSACGSSSGVGSSEIRITQTVVSAQAGFPLQFSYSIYGVTNERGQFNNNPTQTIASTAYTGGTVTPWVQRPGGVNYNINNTIPNTVGNSVLMFTAGQTTNVRALNKPLWYAGKYGGFVDSNANDIPDLDSEWKTNGVPNNFFSVSNPALLEDNLDTIFVTILSRTGSASAVATSSTRLDSKSFVYQAVFESKVWSGELRAYQPDTQGVIPTVATYKTSDAGRMPLNASNRNIVFYKPSNGSTQQLDWSRLDLAQQNLLKLPGESTDANAQNRVDWLKGNPTHENNNTELRERVYIDGNNPPVRNILGDIVNSSPAYVGDYDYNYSSLSGAAGSAYNTFMATKKAATFVPLVLVGANDGMVHAFVADAPKGREADILTEKFAYIPNLVFSKLATITKPDYGSTANPHQYLIDGAITVSDVYTTNGWKTIAVGSLGAGGKGIYALDVTNPGSPVVLFEYSHPSMGYVLGKVFIAPAQNGKWYAVFGNGSGSGTTSKLFMVDINDPVAGTKILETGDGIGLFSPAYIVDSRGVLKHVYAGDLSGNMWHFDLTSSTAANWDVAHNAIYKVFATNSGQPITATPTVGNNSHLGAVMVYFGTGKYFDVGDNLFSSVQQSFYAVPDLGPGNAVTRSSLVARVMSTNYSPASRTIQTVVPDWSTKKGWYIDLDLISGSQINERVTTKALLVQDYLIINTLIPSQKTCEAGGQSWIMSTCAICDRYLANGNVDLPPLDTKLNPEIYSGDLVISLGGAGKASPGLPTNAQDCDAASASAIGSGSMAGLTSNGLTVCGNNYGRQSWRQLR